MPRAVPISPDLAGFRDLALEAHDEGYRFVDRLVSEWEAEVNRFDGRGECLLGIVREGALVAVGGLNVDPFSHDDAIGRLRHIYVRMRWRGEGLGNHLVRALIEAGRPHFRQLRLRTDNPAAVRLYRRLGFVAVADRDATHSLQLTP